jgi:hypothetical protein
VRERLTALASQRAGTIVRTVPQRPKNFRIESVAVRPVDPVRLVPTGPGKAAPATFLAEVRLAEPELLVELGVQVQPGGRPVVHHISVWATPATPLTSGSLHKVLLDPIVRAALDEAQQTIEERSDVAPGAFHVPGEPEEQLWVMTPAGADERVRQIARLYLDAMTAGSKSPGLDAANAVHISRAQAARYIKRARDLGLLPPLEELLKAPAPEQHDPRVDPVADPPVKPDPGPSIFRDPSTPWPGQDKS